MIVKSIVDSFQARIYLGLRRGYSDKIHNSDEVLDFLQAYVDCVGFCVTCSPTTFVYKKGREPGVIIGLINYPRFSRKREELEKIAEDIALSCKERFGQNRISIEYSDKTVMLGDSE